METNVRYTLAGTFVLLMLALIIISIIWISGGISREKYSYYTVYMKESITGLEKDSKVEFNGMDVGTIDDMSINQKNPQLIMLTLKVKMSTPVTAGTKAKLALRGALSGEVYILLEDKGTNKQLLPKKVEAPYPVIPTTPSILVRLDTTLTHIDKGFEQLNQSFREISHSIKGFLSSDLLNSFKRVLQKLGG